MGQTRPVMPFPPKQSLDGACCILGNVPIPGPQLRGTGGTLGFE